MKLDPIILNNPRKFIAAYLLHYKWPLLAGVIFVLLTAVFQLVAPLILRYGVEFIEYKLGGASVQPPAAWLMNLNKAVSSLQLLLIYAGALIVSAAIQGVFRYYMRNTMIGISRKIEFEIRNDYLAHLQKLSASFFQRYKTGDLMARATNDMEAIRSMLGPGIMYMVNTVIVGLFTILLMLSISPVVTLWSLLPMPLVAYIVHHQVAKINKLFGRVQAQFSAVTSKVQENLAGIRIVKSYVQEDHEIKMFDSLNREYIARNMALVKIRGSLWASIEFLLGLTLLTALLVGGWQVIAGKLTIGGLVAFLAYLAMLAWPMIAFGWVLNIWQEGMASCERVLKILQENPEIADHEQTDASLQQIRGSLRFVNVSFAYSADEAPVLTNISIDIPAGATVAIVGQTGSGKSSLVHLVPRLHEATSGQILIDGVDIRRYPLQLLRENIGFVPQETFLFSDTLAENLIFGDPAATEEQIHEAAELSQLISDYDQFPDGWQTMVGERGLTLSGGQKQRAAIARAIMRDPKILILDDALSAVDTYTEDKVLQGLRRFMGGRTTLLVSHRISTVRSADMILVLRNGEIVERGSHEELLDREGFYYRLYQRQLLEQSLEDL